MPTIDLPSGAVHYIEQGRGVPLVLLSANPGEARDFDAIVPALAQRHRVLALDWPGYGQSALPQQADTWSALHFHSVAREFIAALRLPPALFIGNSVGGNVAARLAIETPEQVRGLVLVSPGGFTAHNLATRTFCGVMGSRFALPPRRWAGLYLRRRTPTTDAMLARAAGPQSESGALSLNRAIWRSFIDPRHDLREPARRIRAPTLLMFGGRDPAIPARKDGRIAARCIPHARSVVMPCGHAPFAEMPDAFLGEVLPFLDGCAEQAEARWPGKAA